MKEREIFVFCPHQVKVVQFLEKLKMFEVREVGGGYHPITKNLMCQILYVNIRARLYLPLQKFVDLFIDEEGKRRIKELERIGYLRRDC